MNASAAAGKVHAEALDHNVKAFIDGLLLALMLEKRIDDRIRAWRLECNANTVMKTVFVMLERGSEFH